MCHNKGSTLNVAPLKRTPSGESGSWKFERGHFFLLLQNPVKGGKYSCILPRNAQVKGCLPSESRKKAALVVDETKARLTLLEAENTDLKTLVNTLASKVDNNSATLVCFLIIIVVDETKGKARFALLEAENTDLKTLVNTLASKVDNNSATLDTATRRVAFHTYLWGYRRVNAPNPVIPDRVMLNEGGAYNGTTGNFTVPCTAFYAFPIYFSTQRAFC
nr:hypothetical protein BaRGS_002729 [Batillaria attramentaria]